jgi:hypothetical protein
MKRLITIGAVVIGLALSGCGGDSEKATTSPAPNDPVETPSDSPPPADPGALPPEFMECMADQGFEVSSPDDIHSAPTEILQACFGSLHGGAEAPQR